MGVDPDCIFCKIVSGEIPCLLVHEDEHSFSFLDINPLADAHLLLIPRRHFVRIDEMTPEAIGQVTRHLPRLAAAVVAATGAEGYNVLQNNGAVAGQAVGHVHFHIIPRASGDGLGYRWNAGRYKPGRDQEVQGKILAAMGSAAS